MAIILNRVKLMYSILMMIRDRQGGEWTAPGHLGFPLLYTTPNKNGNIDEVVTFGASQRGSGGEGPLGTQEGQSALTANVTHGILSGQIQPTDYMSLTSDQWGRGVWLYVYYTTGPWDLAPGESVRIITGEVLGTVPYETTVDPATTEADIAEGEEILYERADKAQFIVDQELKGNGWNMPDAPPAPWEVRVEPDLVTTGNVVIWDTDIESIVDPDYGSNDIAGYHIWRAVYSSIGPWELIGTVNKGDATYLSGSEYRFSDNNAGLGFLYYYAVSSFDTGHSNWPLDAAAWTAFNNGNAAVPALESIKTLYKSGGFPQPFTTKRAPGSALTDVRVYPNPFVKSSGFETRGAGDIINFANVPGVCTIKIFTFRGDLIKTIEHNTGFGSATWDQLTDTGQWIESGIYFYQVISKSGATDGQKHIDKFVVIR